MNNLIQRGGEDAPAAQEQAQDTTYPVKVLTTRGIDGILTKYAKSKPGLMTQLETALSYVPAEDQEEVKPKVQTVLQDVMVDTNRGLMTETRLKYYVRKMQQCILNENPETPLEPCIEEPDLRWIIPSDDNWLEVKGQDFEGKIDSFLNGFGRTIDTDTDPYLTVIECLKQNKNIKTNHLEQLYGEGEETVEEMKERAKQHLRAACNGSYLIYSGSQLTDPNNLLLKVSEREYRNF